MFTPPEIIIAVVVIAALIFIPILRRLLGLIIRLAVFFVAVGIVAAGVTMILNNETIFERPGLGQRVERFLTKNSVAASQTGSGSVTCAMESAPPPPPTAAAPHKRAAKKESEPQTTRNDVSKAEPAPLDDVFPELIRRSFPGISREKLFQLSTDTVKSLGGWRIDKSSPSNYTLDCIYTSRIFKLEDDVRISIDPSGDIEVCARSGMARPGTTSMLRYFPGDLGSNIGHIKQFYETLEPKMDQVYKEEQDKQNAKKPPGQ
ncbi:MAG TPA: DUF1499 domain-containing protein [Candidatus Binatus sp.]|uniref:DUF1499 domain-containing protein n=1 Tax=Candidatus Binatus sp. TaxID=2811406 RepID=UPI002F40498F